MNEQLIQRDAETPGAYVGDTLLMMSVQQGQYFSLNEAASRVWELLEKPTTVPALVRQLVSEYEVGEEECRGAVAHFLATLRDRRLLNDVPPPCA
jgi:hypothetical protein